MKKRVELKIGETVASHLAFYTSIVEVAAAAFGSGEKSNSPAKEPITEDLSQADPAHFQARMAQMMSL